jgi:hypothetical protein
MRLVPDDMTEDDYEFWLHIDPEYRPASMRPQSEDSQ